VLFSAPVTISARAVAIYYKGGNACVLSLHEQDEGIVVTGSGRVIMDECIAASNSTDPIDSIVGAGSGYLETDCIYSVGGVSDVSRMQFDAGCVPVVGPPIVDPFAALEVPSPLPCNENNKTVGNSATETLGHPTAAEAAADVGGPIEAAYNARFSTPFVFCSGLVIRGDLTLNPGLYVITDNQLRVNSGATFTGSGVTIVLTTGADIDNFNGGASINLSAPLLDNEAAGNYTTAGDPATATPASDWRGMLFYQDRDSAICTGSNCNQVNGDSASKMTGAMYFPSQELTMQGTNQSGINCLQLVAYEISFSGNSNYVANGNPTNCNGIVKEIEVPDVIKLVE